MDLQKLQHPIECQLALLGFELVLLESAHEGRDEMIRLYVDHLDQTKSVTLDDCVALNDSLLAWMDVEFPLLRNMVGVEISSPGVERPLVTSEHFRRFVGHLCKIQTQHLLNGQKRFKGWINTVSASSVTLEEDGTLKQIPLDQIRIAKLAPFDEAKAPKPKHAAATSTTEPICAAPAMATAKTEYAVIAANELAGAEKSVSKEA
jgi:ribosome maturation factor RimP